MSDMTKVKKISIRLPETLVNFIEDQCNDLSTEAIKWDKSKYIRFLLLEKRNANKVKKWDFPNKEV